MNRWSGGGKQPEVGRTTWILLGVLVLAIVWATSQTRKPRPSLPHAAAPMAVGATADLVPVAGEKTTPEGWGRDPFDPNRVPVGSRNTGR